MSKILISVIVSFLFINEIISQEIVPIEEQFIQTTALITGINSKTGEFSKGTGFFYRDNSLLPQSILLITNKHIVQNKDKFLITFNRIDDLGKIYGNKKIVELTDKTKMWQYHPDPKVDLCYLDISQIISFFHSRGINLSTRSLTKGLIPNDSIWNSMTVLEYVIMIGYPNGISDQKNNIPIIRTGVTATPPKLDYNGLSEFLIDIAAFPGSSGSPVIIRRMPYNARNTSTGVAVGFFPEYYLAGILQSGPTYSPKIKELSFNSLDEITDSLKLETNITINLGNVIKSKEISRMILLNKSKE